MADFLKYLKGVKGMSGGGGLIDRIQYNADEDRRNDTKANALRGLSWAADDNERLRVMADYAQNGGNPNDLREFNKTPQERENYGYAKSVGDSLVDVRTGQPIYTAPQKPQAPQKADYGHLREVGGSLIDLRTGQPVYTAPPKEKEHNIPVGFGDSVRGFIDSRRGVRRKDGGYAAGSAAPLDPAVEDDIARRATRIFKETGDPEEAQQRAYEEVVGNKKLVEGDDTGIENDGSGTFVDDNYRYVKPEGYRSGITKQGSGRPSKSAAAAELARRKKLQK